MHNFLFDTGWFFDLDIAFDLFSFFVTFIIAFYANKISKYGDTIRYRYFSVSFLLIGIGFLAKSITNFIIHHPMEIYNVFGVFLINHSVPTISVLPFLLGFIIYRIAILFGLIGILIIVSRYRDILKYAEGLFLIILFIYFAIITTIFTWSTFYIFHMTSVLVLSGIYYEYSQKYIKNKKRNLYLIKWAFIFLILSQLMFLFTNICTFFYILAETMQLIGFSILAFIFYKILKC